MTDRALVVRSGHSFAIEVPWSRVASVSVRERSRESSRGVQVDEGATGENGAAGDVLSVVMASRTNVDVRLRTPVELPVLGAVRRVTEVRLFADDPRAVARACRGRLDAAASA